MGYRSDSQRDEAKPETRKESVQRLRRTDCRHIIVRNALQYTQLCQTQ